MNNDAHIDDLIDLYALGVLEPAQHAAVEQHLEQCSACRAELARSTQVVELLAWTPQQYDPPAGSYERLVERIKQSQPQPHAPSQPVGWAGRLRQWLLPPSGFRPAFAAVLLLLALGLGGWNLNLRQRLNNSQSQLATLQRQAQADQQLAELLGAPGTQLVALASQDTASQNAHSQLVINRQRRAAYFASDGLKPLPAGQDYQLWFIADGVPVSAGVFHVDQQGRAAFMVSATPLPTNAQAAGVTVEPAGGSAQPTVAPLLIGQF